MLFRWSSVTPQGYPLSYRVPGNRTFELAHVDGTLCRTEGDDFLKVRKLIRKPAETGLDSVDSIHYAAWRHACWRDAKQRGG